MPPKLTRLFRDGLIPKKRKRKPQKYKSTYSVQYLSAILERIEKAIECESIQLVELPTDVPAAGRPAVDLATLGVLLATMFPDRYTATAPFVPTSTAPGTKERQAVYRARLKAGQSVFHPDDACPIRDDRKGLDGNLRRNGGSRSGDHAGSRISAEFTGWHRGDVDGDDGEVDCED